MEHLKLENFKLDIIKVMPSSKTTIGIVAKQWYLPIFLSVRNTYQSAYI